jgi:phosphoglycolate phosphatase
VPEAPNTLLLFDIDGTLVDCGVAAGKCFSAAFREVFGVACPIFTPEEVSGLTDAAILMEVVRRLDIRCQDFAHRRDLAFEIYARNLALELRRERASEIPGASRAVRAARSIPGCVVGLLTGSTETTARIKLESAGMDFGQFACSAFSEDGELRETLPPAARARFAQFFGRAPIMTVLIGDTPRDVQAALAAGCEFIGVTTGPYGRPSLKRAGARIILKNLNDTEALCAAIGTLRRQAPTSKRLI